MEEITIYRFQLEEIIEALRLTDRIYNTSKRVTSYDRVVCRAQFYAKNALNGKIDEPYKIVEI